MCCQCSHPRAEIPSKSLLNNMTLLKEINKLPPLHQSLSLIAHGTILWFFAIIFWTVSIFQLELKLVIRRHVAVLTLSMADPKLMANNYSRYRHCLSKPAIILVTRDSCLWMVNRWHLVHRQIGIFTAKLPDQVISFNLHLFMMQHSYQLLPSRTPSENWECR